MMALSDTPDLPDPAMWAESVPDVFLAAVYSERLGRYDSVFLYARECDGSFVCDDPTVHVEVTHPLDRTKTIPVPVWRYTPGAGTYEAVELKRLTYMGLRHPEDEIFHSKERQL